MGSVIDNEKTKIKCQIFTPDDIVKGMLDYLGYRHNLYGKKIFESSCGNGQFLKEIVQRYIDDGNRRGLTRTKIKNGLGRDVFAIELDPARYQECIAALNSITDRYGLKRVTWQIKQADALRETFDDKFDYVVGNPPYISYWDLELSEREYVEKKFTACQYGTWDYAYAFLQDGFNHLNSRGKMAFIIPNSVYKTKSGRNIRNILSPFLTQVYDYTTTNVFENVLTSPTIIVVDRSTQSPEIVYTDLSRGKTVQMQRNLLGDEWLFTAEPQPAGHRRFGDYFKVATGVATQYNKAFVLSGYTDVGTYIEKDKIRIEKGIVRNAASPKGKAYNSAEFIIFPYYYQQDKLMHYSESSFKEKYPLAFAHLKTEQQQLEERDSDPSAKWFEYGRSQALAHINQEKLLVSTVITGKVRVYELGKEDVPYSGLFITLRPVKNPLSLTIAKDVLMSDDFLKYIEPRGISARGKSIRITAKMIEEYRW